MSKNKIQIAEDIRTKDNIVNEKWVIECNKFIDENLKEDLRQIKGVFLPGDDFYIDGDKKDAMLHMASKIFKWLKVEVKSEELVINFDDKIDSPGVYFEDKGQKNILINTKYKNNIFAIGAILAHEIMHFFLIGRKKLRMEDTLENELLTDLCTIRFGLGLVIINGMHYSNSWFFTTLVAFSGSLYWSTKELSFGYYNPNQYGKLVYEQIENKKIPFNDVGGYIHPYSRKFLPISFSEFLKVKKPSTVIATLIKKSNKTLIEQVCVLIIFAITVFHFDIFNYQNNAKQTALSLELVEIQKLEKSLEQVGPEIDKLILELEDLDKKLTSLAQEGNSDEYNKLVDIYNNKLTELEEYNEEYEKYEAMVEDYNSKL